MRKADQIKCDIESCAHNAPDHCCRLDTVNICACSPCDCDDVHACRDSMCASFHEKLLH